MNLLSVKRKGHGIDEWIRRETPNSRGLQLVKTHSLLYNKYHYVSHNDCGLISCSDTNISNPSKSSINITIKKQYGKIQKCPTIAISWVKLYWSVIEFPRKCENERIFMSLLLFSFYFFYFTIFFYKAAILKKWKLRKMHWSPSLYSS